MDVRSIDSRIEPYQWAFAREERARIDAHWAEQRRLRPRLFDGRVLLAHHVEVVGGCLRTRYFETGFKSFLAWRDFGFPDASIVNCFAMAALISADGVFLLGEMSPSTANAGLLYFPSGTPEPADADPDGRVDLEANTLRELAEETGLQTNEVTVEPGWTIMFDGPRVGCMKMIRSRETAEALQARVLAFNAAQNDPELVRLVPVAGPADLDADRMPGFMRRYLETALNSRRGLEGPQAR